ncbi:MAG: DMT family transporter [Nitrospinaceae bacterium]|nr:DMT family transporter [Nitrospinaceae bacterium]
MLALFAWAALSFCVRSAMRDAPLLRTTATITTTNALFMIPVAFSIMPLSAFRPERSETIYYIVALGLCMIAASRLTYYFAIRRIGPSRALPVATSTPIIPAFIAAAWVGEPVTLRLVFGLILLAGGINFAMRAEPAQDSNLPTTSRDRTLGWIAAGVTVCIWSISGVTMKVIASDVPPLAAAAMIIWSGVFFTWMIAFLGSKSEAGLKVPKASWPWITASAVCQTVAVPSFVSAMHYTFAVNASSITAVQPLLALLVAHFFIKEAENITWGLVVGAVMTVCGTLVVLLLA